MGFQRLGQATYLNIGVYLLNTSLLYYVGLLDHMGTNSGRIKSKKGSIFKMKVSVLWILFILVLAALAASNEPIDEEIIQGTLTWFLIIVFVSCLEFIFRKSVHFCRRCGVKLGKGMKFYNTPKTKVISITNSSKVVSSINPGIALGSIGGKNAGGVTLNTSKTHIPIVLGIVEASVLCPSKICGAKNKWKFSTEVEVWTDVQNGSQSYKIVGEKKPPV